MERISASTSAHSSGCATLPVQCDGLTDYSPKDAPWDVHRSEADDVGGIYAGAVEFDHVRFGYDPDRLIINDFTAQIQAGQAKELNLIFGSIWRKGR